jgi:hypothetical protein
MAKGKHPGMGDRPDIHGDTGEGIAQYVRSTPCASTGLRVDGLICMMCV